ncbi:MAG: excinuclease ABC subunit UvrC [Cetobacterium sp.]|uniref:excinuclease ABC subunit UvrC n=1 Tax=unclassified Cetobacterium TaxID=2630983 RepID=UPI00163C4A47|nr:excinuclease ABC subunit UvrC [Cetobacterium sp. 2A]MBC2855856.1 excinuclease ABC subunit UvrC [Cetobacterium sp. 2A]
MDIKKIEIPDNPGVYLMKKAKKVIYVGKAKNLKKRVSSYFNRDHQDEKTKELVKNIENIEFILCNNELDALILENNLIKKYSPKYNIALKDEKTYPYIKISKELFPKISIVRTTKGLDLKSGEYYGPYPQGTWNLKKSLVKLFQIRDCNRDMDKIYSRPCLKYYMNLCLGPCSYKDILEEYSEQVEGLKKVLKGNGQEIIKNLEIKMLDASENMEFEKAILYREQKKELEKTLESQITEHSSEMDEDIFTFFVEKEKIFLCILNQRNGKIVGKNSTVIDLKDKIYENLFIEVVSMYYTKYPVPKNIVFSSENIEEKELLENYFKTYTGEKVTLYFPKIKSRRRELLDMSFLNLMEDVDSYYNKKEILELGLIKLYEVLKLKKIPMRIECFDISNIQGKDAVASMSVAIEGRPAKQEYRRFRIKTKDTPDDYAMMREVIERRYSKLDKKDFPEVILIDGGLGQINAVGQILESIGKSGISDLISIAKKEELIFKYGESEPYHFSKAEEALKILQRVRDEAHRFAVTYHRLLRSKRVIGKK